MEGLQYLRKLIEAYQEFDGLPPASLIVPLVEDSKVTQKKGLFII